MIGGAIAVSLARFSVGSGDLVAASQVRPITTVSATVLPATTGPVTGTRTGDWAGALAGGTAPPCRSAHRLHGSEPSQARTATYWLPRSRKVTGAPAMPAPVCHVHSPFPVAALRA